MDEYSEDAFVNRDEAIPIVSFDGEEDSPSDETIEVITNEGKRQTVRRHRSSSVRTTKDNVSGVKPVATASKISMQDRLLEKLLQKVIPVEDLSENRGDDPTTVDQSFVDRPSFNISTMSTNFRRFNSRIGVVFVFQASMIRLLSWKKQSHTLSLLAVYTFVCLDPYLITVLPLIILLLSVLIPSFLTRHPAPPTTVSSFNFEYSPTGPPIAPAPTVKPVKELSKDFFRNMRDLQNCMEDFSRVHDHVIGSVGPPTNFSNEALSSTIVLGLFVLCFTMFTASHLLPWRHIALVIGWSAIISGHPSMAQTLRKAHKEHIQPHSKTAKLLLDRWIATDILLDSAPEEREVEIFELQRLSNALEWEPYLFTGSPYTPGERERIAGDNAKGSRFFEDVRAPRGWEWAEKKWTLDLWSREWVEERCLGGVEVEMEGERWVWDLVVGKDGREALEDVLTSGSSKGKSKAVAKEKEREREREREMERDGEGWGGGVGVGVASGTIARRGEWRRRRWVRLVRRKAMSRAME